MVKFRLGLTPPKRNHMCQDWTSRKSLCRIERVPKKCIHILRKEKTCAPRTTTVIPPFSLTVLPIARWR